MADLFQEFFEQLQKSSHALLVLDYDGTVAEYNTDSDKALMVPGVADRLIAIHRTGHTRIIFNTGRLCENVVMMAKLPFPVEVWGCHGRTHLELDGDITVHGVKELHREGLKMGEHRLKHVRPDLHMLLRPGCLTVFYREATTEERAWITNTAIEVWRELLDVYELKIDHFFGGIELSAIGRSKGDAMEAILREVDPDTTPVAFLGDTATDEDGFRAMQGRGLAVLVNETEDPDTMAHVRLTSYQEVLDFLERWLEMISGPRPT